MIFHPQNLIKKDETFVLPKSTFATAHTAINKDVMKELWHNYSYHTSNLEIKETNDLSLMIGEAELLSLDGEDYAINIERSGISLNAKDSNSLIHGYMTLLDRIKPIDGDRAMVECCEIKESAQIGHRMVHFCVFPETELWELRKFFRFSAALKLTHVIIEFWGTLKFDCMKELGWDTAFTKDEVRPIIAEARELGLEIVPMFNHWGHAALSRAIHGKHVVLDQNFSLASYFSENGWCWAIEKEKVKNLLRSVRDELIELCGEGSYFHIGCDEADGFTYSEEEMDFIISYLNEISGELSKKGRRAIAWGDMFIYAHEEYNKENRYICHAPSIEIEKYMLSRLNKNIIIADWQYYPKNTPVETSLTFKNAGFDTLICPWDKDKEIIGACVDTVKQNHLLGFIHTTWNSLSLGIKHIPTIAMGAYEDISLRKENPIYNAAYVMRRVYNVNGNYEMAGWSKKQVDDITHI